MASILAAALTEEQRRGRPKDPPFLLRLRCTDLLIPIEIPVQNAAAGIYEMASKVNGWLTELTDSLTDRTFKIARFYRGPNDLTAKNKYIPPPRRAEAPAKADHRVEAAFFRIRSSGLVTDSDFDSRTERV